MPDARLKWMRGSAAKAAGFVPMEALDAPAVGVLLKAIQLVDHMTVNGAVNVKFNWKVPACRYPHINCSRCVYQALAMMSSQQHFTRASGLPPPPLFAPQVHGD